MKYFISQPLPTMHHGMYTILGLPSTAYKTDTTFFIAYFKNCNFNFFCRRNVIGPSPVKPQQEEIPKARSLEEKYYKFL